MELETYVGSATIATYESLAFCKALCILTEQNATKVLHSIAMIIKHTHVAAVVPTYTHTHRRSL